MNIKAISIKAISVPSTVTQLSNNSAQQKKSSKLKSIEKRLSRFRD